MTHTMQDEIKKGIREGAPIAAGYFPIAIAFGALAVEAGLKAWEGAAMSLFVYAGASQFMAAGMILSGVGTVQIVAATFFLNLRHVMMSMAVNRRWDHLPGRWKKALSFWITDETFAFLTLGKSGQRTPFRAAALLLTAYLGWVSGTIAGTLSVRLLPAAVSGAMTMGLYALFIGLLMPSLREDLRVGAVVAASMTLNWGLQSVLPAGWAVVVTTAAGAGLGALILEEGE